MRLVLSRNSVSVSVFTVVLAVVSFLQPVIAADSPNAVAKKISEGAMIIDVRTREEFSQKHYPAAVNIPVDELQNRLTEILDKKISIVVYCRSGRRSAIAKDILLKNGYTDVTDGGGLDSMPVK